MSTDVITRKRVKLLITKEMAEKKIEIDDIENADIIDGDSLDILYKLIDADEKFDAVIISSELLERLLKY